MKFPSQSITMQEALLPDQCSIVSDFLHTLIQSDNKLRSIGKKVDVGKFIAEYRLQAGSHNPYSNGQKQRQLQARLTQQQLQSWRKDAIIFKGSGQYERNTIVTRQGRIN